MSLARCRSCRAWVTTKHLPYNPTTRTSHPPSSVPPTPTTTPCTPLLPAYHPFSLPHRRSPPAAPASKPFVLPRDPSHPLPSVQSPARPRSTSRCLALERVPVPSRASRGTRPGRGRAGHTRSGTLVQSLRAGRGGAGGAKAGG